MRRGSFWCLWYTNSHMTHITGPPHYMQPGSRNLGSLTFGSPPAAARNTLDLTPRPNQTPTLPLPLRLALHLTNPCSDFRQEHQDSPKLNHTSTDSDPHAASVSPRAVSLWPHRARQRLGRVPAPALLQANQRRAATHPPGPLQSFSTLTPLRFSFWLVFLRPMVTLPCLFSLPTALTCASPARPSAMYFWVSAMLIGRKGPG